MKDDTAQRATYTFDHCTGPLGLLSITGTIVVAWSVDAASGALTLNASGTGVQFNRAMVDSWTASATITSSGATRTMAWSATLAGTTARGRAFSRTNHKTMTWTVGGSCVTVDGTAEGQVAARHLHTDVSGYERCGGCPRAGTIPVSNEDSGKVVQLAFDGSADAPFTAANGAKTDVPLDCVP